MAKKVKLHGVFDVDANAVAYVYKDGTAAEQKEAAQGQIDRLLLHVGDGAPRDLRVVAITEA